MKNPLRCDGCNGVGLLLARVPLGIVLALAGYRKMVAPGGVSGFVSTASHLVPSYMPSWFGGAYLHAVPYAELGLGLLLVAGLLTRVSGLLAALMLLSFGMAQGGADGFFNFQASMAPKVFQAPFTYGALALVAAFSGPGAFSLDRLFFGQGKAMR